MNPYESPYENSEHARPDHGSPYGIDPRSAVNGPAMSLMIVSGLWLLMVFASIAFNVYLFASGAIDQLPDPPGGTVTKETQVAIRLIWAIVLLVCNLVILFGAIQMRQLSNYSLAKWSASLAVVPCVGPCYLLGMPFGIWALVVLNKPEIQREFR